MNTALLVIDVQKSFKHQSFWSEKGVDEFISKLNLLIRGAAFSKIPVVQVFHTAGNDVPENPFAMSSMQIKPLLGLAEYEPALTVYKHRRSALVETDLSSWLVRQRISRLLISGIRTEQCCESTARHASDSGYEVDFVSEACLTFDMVTSAGRTLTAKEIRERTEVVLKDRFATIVTVDQALARVCGRE